MDPVPTEWSIPRAVLALPCGSRSMSRTRRPCRASAAAMLTAVVVFPTPPFWLATVMIRVAVGRGHCSCRTLRTSTARRASRAIGVSSSASSPTTGSDPIPLMFGVSRETGSLACGPVSGATPSPDVSRETPPSTSGSAPGPDPSTDVSRETSSVCVSRSDSSLIGLPWSNDVWSLPIAAPARPTSDRRPARSTR